jgi:hypothetical protein
MTNIPNITPYTKEKYTCKQSKYEMVSELPVRTMVSDKRVYIFSTSIHIDAAWKPVIEYCATELKQYESEKEQYYFDTFDYESSSLNRHL